MADEYIRPGEVVTPMNGSWAGPRCEFCGQGIGGDGIWSTCQESGQVCATWAGIDKRKLERFFAERCWSNAMSQIGILDAIEWMTDEQNGASAVAKIRAGNGLEVFNLQMATWPSLAQTTLAMRRMAA